MRFNCQLREKPHPSIFEVLLDAKDGPLGTRDDRIRREAMSLPQNRTFLHLTHSYSANFAARLATMGRCSRHCCLAPERRSTSWWTRLRLAGDYFTWDLK